MMKCCDGRAEDHDGRPGQCTRALIALCERIERRPTEEQERVDNDRRVVR